MKRFLVYLAATLASACSNDAPIDDAARRPPTLAGDPIDRPEIHLVGCAHLERDLCVLEPDSQGRASLQMWLDLASSATIRADVGGDAVALSTRPVDGGLAVEVPLAMPATSLSLEGDGPPWTEPFEIRFEWEPPPPAVVAARDQIARNEKNEAITALQAALPTLEGPGRLRALDLLRRALYDVGRDTESFARAEEAAALAEALGRTRDGAAAASSVVFANIQARRWSQARQWLARMEAIAGALPQGRVWGGYGRGLISSATGDLTGALRALSMARRWSERLSMFGGLLDSLDQHAVVLSELGRAEEAQALIRRGVDLARTEESTCVQRAQHLGNLGWAQLRLVEADLAHDLPHGVFEEALAALEAEGPCPTPGKAANMRVNLALTALAHHEYEDAFAWYSELQATGYPGWLAPWVDEVAARISVATGRWELHPPSMLSPPKRGELGLDWSGLVRHARSMAVFGHVEAAADAFASAEALLDEAISTVGIDAGRELFLARREASAEGLVEALVEQGKVDEALCHARIARGRALRSIDRAARIASLDPDQRDEWQRQAIAFVGIRRKHQRDATEDWMFDGAELDRRRSRRTEELAEATADLDDVLRSNAEIVGSDACAPLPPASERELLVFTFPAGEQTLVFAADDRSVDVSQVRDVSKRPTAEQSKALLGPFARRIDAAARIRVAASGWSRALPFHALPWRDGVLLDRAPVVYELGLPTRHRSKGHGRRAVVVADPTDSLPFARAEAAAVEQTLARNGWTVRTHEREEATRDAFIAALAGASILHYAGHGTRRGRSGWDSALLLHQGELGVTDILALPHVPSTVVLAGCETGSRESMALAGNMSLGRAFVLAGSGQVVVADAKIDDALARRVGEALYEHLPADNDVAEALRQVQLSLRADHPDKRWAVFRVLVP